MSRIFSPEKGTVAGRKYTWLKRKQEYLRTVRRDTSSRPELPKTQADARALGRPHREQYSELLEMWLNPQTQFYKL
jgi:hypothetical protein